MITEKLKQVFNPPLSEEAIEIYKNLYPALIRNKMFYDSIINGQNMLKEAVIEYNDYITNPEYSMYSTMYKELNEKNLTKLQDTDPAPSKTLGLFDVTVDTEIDLQFIGVARATTAQISMAKRNNVEIALDIAREARQIHGGMGITSEYSIMRHMANLESVVTYEGTHDIHLLITGAEVTGIPAFTRDNPKL